MGSLGTAATVPAPMNVDQHSLPPRGGALTLVLAVLWIVGCGIIDWWTGPEFAFSAFYLPGVAAVGWFHGRKAAVGAAALAALAWLAAELPWNVSYSNPLAPYWNAFVRWLVFVVTAVLVGEVRIRQFTEGALREQRGILSAILESMRDGVMVVNAAGRIMVFNSAARTLFRQDALNASQEEWLRRLEGLDLEPAVSLNRLIPSLRHALAANTACAGEVTLHGSEAGPRFCVFNAMPVARPGRPPQGRVVVFSDLTTRRLLENRVLQATELAQRRIAQDLHDGLSQHLASVAFAADELQDELAGTGHFSTATKAEEIAMLVRAAIGQAKALARGLYPAGLAESLSTALQNLAITAENRSGVSCEFKESGTERPLAPETAGHLFRIAQESVTNALRHASPRRVRICLDHQPQALSVAISDDGIGMPLSPAERAGIGLQIIQHRANLIGADLEVRADPDGGTVVSCVLPLPLP